MCKTEEHRMKSKRLTPSEVLETKFFVQTEIVCRAHPLTAHAVNNMITKSKVRYRLVDHANENLHVVCLLEERSSQTHRLILRNRTGRILNSSVQQRDTR